MVRHHIGDESFGGAGSFGLHECVTNPGQRGERADDFGGLDPVAAQFDLVVLTAEELDVPVRAQPRPVAGAIEPCAGDARERVRHEAPRGEAGLVQIAACHTRAADVQLAWDTERRGVAVLVEHVHGGVRDRPPDRHHLAALGPVDRIGRVGHGDLGGAVLVEHPGTVRAGQVQPAVEHRGREGVRTDREHARDVGRLVRGKLLAQQVQVPGGELDEGERACLGKQPAQVRRLEVRR